MADWQPLSVRRGAQPPFELEEWIPRHLTTPLLEWLNSAMSDDMGYDESAAARDAAVALHVPITAMSSSERRRQLLEAAMDDASLFLDVLDFFLHYRRRRLDWLKLDDLLDSGHSAWRVSDSHHGLERRVSDASTDMYRAAQLVGDSAAEELSHAWSKAYGTAPDPSDAWDHAIKAVEAVLAPIVVPNAPKPTLGSMIGALDVPAKWHFDLPGGDLSNGEQPLVAALRMMWPNPDRHGAGANRPPTQAEAETVVQLATTIVQWLHSGALRLR